ncbi:hypothetical protein CHL78_019675 [Romboutsia weinsteinii]|uniref:ABC transporter permease n=1 Tax=Romboutsia weinsteinii TaxID=2020949 RepID=A0A371IXH1_9FIRM|nr:ABC transporter permease [Romboutsia weinsteinii]RDY25161.1 hypothetical protein CHL78_019675 [Romboutsia weinsteinii]
MYNLIKSELYKLRFGKTYKGLCIFSIWCIFMTVVTSFNAESSGLQFIATYINDRRYGFFINTFSDVSNIKGIEFFASGMGWTLILVIGLTYVVSMFTCDEYVNGTYKSVLSYGNKRKYVYISKLITICVGICILVFAIPTMTLIIGTIINGWGIKFEIEHINQMIKLLSINAFIFISIASVFMLIATIIKNKALLVTIGTCVLVSPVLLLDKIPLDILRNHPMFMLMDTCANMPNQEFITQIIFTCSIITIVSIVVGIYIFENQDII